MRVKLHYSTVEYEVVAKEHTERGMYLLLAATCGCAVLSTCTVHAGAGNKAWYPLGLVASVIGA